MALILAFVGYALVLYGWHIASSGWHLAGCIMLAVAFAVFRLGERLTARGDRSSIDEPIDQPMKEIPPR